ncbi:MAG: hypothetical protein HYZ75_08160 [Elusimicrobia bacterium]|nr:hypothetical protein [Elusimicrobiota bacterium]
MRLALWLSIFFLAIQASAQTRTSGDATVTGAMGAGTLTPRAALEIGLHVADSYALKVSSPDGSALYLLDRSAKAGLGVTPTGARLDVSGRADAGEVGLELRAGNSTSSLTSAQIAFGAANGAYRHNIRSRATGTQSAGNALDFYLWTSSDAVYSLGSSYVMSLQGSTTTLLGVHVSPSTQSVTAELVVSSGTVYAGGIILAADAVGAPCFSDIKHDLGRLEKKEREAAQAELLALRPVSFRYKGDLLERKGFVYEEAPASIRDGRGAIVLDERLLNLELVLQAAQGRIERLTAELTHLERRGR